LIFKGDHLAELGDARAASAFYKFALQAAPPANECPADLRGDLGRAQAMCARYAAQFEGFLMERIARQSKLDERAAARFRLSLELLLGKKQIYIQQPQTYFFPELPQIQFYDATRFPWVEKVEAATERPRRAPRGLEGRTPSARHEASPVRPRRNRRDCGTLTGARPTSKNGEVVAKTLPAARVR
jgi:hypothetical protein